VYDHRGKIVGQPSDSLTGRTDGRCPDFNKERCSGQIIWQSRQTPNDGDETMQARAASAQRVGTRNHSLQTTTSLQHQEQGQ